MSRGLGDVYKRQIHDYSITEPFHTQEIFFVFRRHYRNLKYLHSYTILIEHIFDISINIVYNEKNIIGGISYENTN